MLLLLCLIIFSKHLTRGYQTLSKDYNFIKLNDFKLNLHNIDKHKFKDSQTNKNEINFNFLSNLHKNAFEHPEFQLHIPPTSNTLPKLNKYLSNSTLITTFNNSNNYLKDDNNLNVSNNQLEINNNKQEVKEQDDKEKEEDEEDYELDNYLDGPLDVLKMVRNAQISEYRHYYSSNSTTNNYKEDKKDKNRSMFSCWWERPCDVFILNYSLIDMNVREYIYLSVKVLEKTEIFDKLQERMKELLNSISKQHLIPNWLLTLFRYCTPLAKSFSDFVYLTYFLVSKYFENDNDELKPFNSQFDQNNSKNDTLDKLKLVIKNWNPLELVDYLSQDHYKLNFDFFQLFNWKSNGIYTEMSNLFLNINLNNLFMKERMKLTRDRKLYNNLLKFKNNNNSHISYNISLIQLINYYIHYFKMPIYLITDFESVNEVKYRLNLFGIKHNNLLTILSSSSSSNNNSKQDKDNKDDNINEVMEQLLNKLKLDALIPVHYFDNSISNLTSLILNPKLNNVRFYFTDWGRSTYNDKLKALYNNKIKYIKNNKSLIEFLCKFNLSDSREFTHGFKLRNPFEEQFNLISNWKSHHSSP